MQLLIERKGAAAERAGSIIEPHMPERVELAVERGPVIGRASVPTKNIQKSVG